MTAVVVAERVHKQYGALEVLKGIDLTVKKGEVVCILGPSGSGKSTFLRCINQLEEISSGHIFVNDELMGYKPFAGRLHRLSTRAMNRQRRGIGMVFQHFNLFPHMTVLENLMLAPVKVGKESKTDARSYAMELLENVKLASKANAYPSELSGGQQQRVGIARALAMKPNLMLFDEPTSALDPELVGEVLETLRDLASAGMTMLIVTHEVAFAREVADTVVFMDQGVVVETGDAREVLERPTQERTREFLRRALKPSTPDKEKASR